MRASFSHRLPWPNPPNALALELDTRKRAGFELLNFVDSNPTRVGLDREGSLLVDLLANPESLRYAPEARGLFQARDALSHFLSRSGGDRAIGPEELFLCASTSEAYAWLFKLLCDSGDAVLVPKPGYPLFDFLSGLEEVEARSYRLEYGHPRGWRVDLDSLEKGLALGRAKAIVLINPNNPSGSYIERGERRAIVELASRYGAALIVDEVFLGFPVERQFGAGGPPEASFLGEKTVLTFVLDGLSKLMGLPQMKLGWIAASGPSLELAEALSRLEIVADTYLSAASPVMWALPAYLGIAPGFAESLGLRLRGNMANLRSTLEGRESAHRVLLCEGGWTALIESPRLESEEDLALGLLREEGLVVHPGYYFDMEKEAYFAVSLLLEPGLFDEGTRRFRAYFDRLLSMS